MWDLGENNMVKNIFIVLISILLVLVLSFILYSFYLYFESIELFILKTGAAVILFFTGLVIMRYMLLLFFSMLKILIKSSDEDYSTFESKTQELL